MFRAAQSGRKNILSHSIRKTRQTCPPLQTAVHCGREALPAPRPKRSSRLWRRMQDLQELDARCVVQPNFVGNLPVDMDECTNAPVTMARAVRCGGLGSWDRRLACGVDRWAFKLRIAPMTLPVGWPARLTQRVSQLLTVLIACPQCSPESTDVVFVFRSPAPHICRTYCIHARGVASDTPGNIRCVTSVHAEAQSNPIA
jgi:hypothetical protein